MLVISKGPMGGQLFVLLSLFDHKSFECFNFFVYCVFDKLERTFKANAYLSGR